ncbi:MAG: OmpA family protein [Bacteroidales bacterium]|nr:OmpA family protein [Bacteroidales bacterium]MBN2758783.1 OmpA family protein [Bacteroidales bacterium]
MRLQNLLTILFVILLANNTILAQNKKTKKADASFDAGEYFKASEMYKKIYTKANTKILKAELSFKLGECFRKMNIPAQSEKWYKKAVKYRFQNPMAVCYLADAYRMNEKYDDAKIEYEKYTELVPDDIRGSNGIKSCNLADESIKNPERYIIENIKEINSKQSDYKPEYFNDYSTLYFTSTREGGVGNSFNNNSGQNFADIFYSTKDRKGKWSEPVPIKGQANSIFDEGACTINLSNTEMYYTSCKLIKNETNGCQIYRSKLNGNLWSTPELIPLIEDSSISVGHPALSPDELSLYFVADLPEGKGGKDIWIAKRISITQPFGKPINLGSPVNTADDETFPYVKKDGTFYFASNGHIGIGGLDIYKLEKNENGEDIVVNLKSPINSSSDDFAIIFENQDEKGYFSSTRPGGKGSDDIYSFELPPILFAIQGIIKNEITTNVIDKAKVKLIGSNGTSLETFSGVDGSFKFKLKPETDYIITTQKDNFLKGKAKESTKGLNKSQTIAIEIFMSPIEKPIEVENIFYDLNKANLRPESEVALDQLVETLNDNSTITIELSAHTDYRGTDESNLNLSQRRAQSVVDYLIKKGIKPERLTAKGYGESVPKTITTKFAQKYSFLKVGDILNKELIDQLATKEQKEEAHQINRRTEFKVLKTDFNESGIQFGE